MAEKEYIDKYPIVRDLIAMKSEYDAITLVGIIKALQDAPAADVVEVVHGEWIFDFELDGSNFYKCSVCGRQEVLLAKESTDEYFPYCHCGAKMDGERKEQNNV